jgi:hypothetical protein
MTLTDVVRRAGGVVDLASFGIEKKVCHHHGIVISAENTPN